MSLLTPLKASPSIPHVLMESNQSASTSSFDSAVGEPPFRRKKLLSWWVIIHTTIPECTYYFGPFLELEEAKTSQFGYIEDLLDEQARGLSVVIKRCQPTTLTESVE